MIHAAHICSKQTFFFQRILTLPSSCSAASSVPWVRIPSKPSVVFPAPGLSPRAAHTCFSIPSPPFAGLSPEHLRPLAAWQHVRVRGTTRQSWTPASGHPGEGLSHEQFPLLRNQVPSASLPVGGWFASWICVSGQGSQFNRAVFWEWVKFEV